MYKYLYVFLIVFCIQSQTYAHSGKPKYHIIIDTDGAIDDMRVISTFLAYNDVRVLAITCSQGTLKPLSCYNKVRSLLTEFHHEGIPIGMGNEINYRLPKWNSFAENIEWGNKINQSNNTPNAIDIINNSIENYPFKITLIALGSLRTYSDLLKKHSKYSEKIERIIWYNDSEKGFNYLIDTASYNYIKKLNIPIDIVSNNRTDLLCNSEYLTYLKNTNSLYAQQIYKVHHQPKVQQNHLQLWDDLLPLYLYAPILFDIEENENIRYITLEKSIPVNLVDESIANILLSANYTNNGVFNSFPTDSTLYKKEYAKILTSTIKNYGEIEWKAISMTNEIHGHTGIYSIIGAKMGIRACEYFNVGVNNLKVTTYVGSKPPFSCLNDGIQISTGATIGQGLITISDTILKIPTVIFELNNQKIKISLKPEIAKKMQDDIAQGVKEYGMSNEYWIYIENLAIQYWAEFNRHEIFIIVKM